MNYIFDTNILVKYLREDNFKQYIEEVYELSNESNRIILSIVSVGEIKSLSLKNKWGERKIKLLEAFIKKFIIIDIRYMDLVERYAEIDVFSQGKLSYNKLGLSSRNMGKNDLWIAATASITASTLITYDKDFTHLDKVYLKLDLLNK